MRAITAIPSEVSDAPADRSGGLIDARYRLMHRLGARATLYKARRLSLDEPVLIRVLPAAPTGQALQRFLSETRTLAALHHGHIVRVIDSGVDMSADGGPAAYVAMEYLRGENLTTTMALHGPLHWTRVLTIAEQICRALIAAHRRGIVHGDIRPAKCFRIRGRATPDFIKLLDFGVSGAASDHRSPTTPACPADDLHALGVLMYRLVTDEMPASPPLSLREAFPALDIPPAFEAVVLAALAQDPLRRPACARAMYQALVSVEPASAQMEPAPCEAPTPPATEQSPPVQPMETTYGALFHLSSTTLGPLWGDHHAPVITRPDEGWDALLWPTWALWAAVSSVVLQMVMQLQ